MLTQAGSLFWDIGLWHELPPRPCGFGFGSCPGRGGLRCGAGVAGVAVTQSVRHSALESVANVAIGYGWAIVAQKAIFPIFNIHVSTADNLKMGLYFTGFSLVRSFVLRRVFNGMVK